jgi:UDP-N-acetylmuramoyl-L-alanyl-D-glutamate--2,6-diaminopimelate ligase
LTTPDPVALHRTLQRLAADGIDHVAVEASSHGLDQFRLDGLALSAAAFTNLTRDHLDYHRHMAAYFAAKRRLFVELLPPGASAVINLDVDEGRELAALCRGLGHRVIGFGRDEGAELRLLRGHPDGAGQIIEVAAFGTRRMLVLPLLGEFQAMNALAALGLAVATGVPVGDALEALATLEGAPGRMAHVASHPNGAPVIVDYAHTPDALETALTALRPHCRGRLVVAFGCGGDRDAGKRPLMGAIAQRLADIVIVTDDNPRGEDAAAIRRAVLAAAPGAHEIGDRRSAIRAAIKLLAPGDVLLLAGKGHERGQIVGATVLPFDDSEVARAAVAEAVP